MPNSQRFPYTALRNALGEVIPRPMLTAQLINREQSISVSGLVDSGADVNVLPYRLGVALGLIWDDQRYTIYLTGNLANFEARAIILSVQIGDLPPIDLAFAWVSAEQVPLIFGQTNFFETFDVCFYRTEEYFIITPKNFTS
ncbi:MAG: hypothetical protein ABI947_19730 [Chloroflexota bacterium]